MSSSVNIEAAITQWKTRAPQRVTLDPRRQIRPHRFHRVGLGGDALAVRRQHHVARVGDEERDAGEERCPQQVPRHVRENLLAPGAVAPRQEVVHASTPRIARFTRFRINGTL